MPKWIWIVLFLIVLLSALVLWLNPKKQIPVQDPADSSQILTATRQISSDTQRSTSQSLSQQDTQVNCQLRLNDHGQLIVNEQTKQCFEYFISQYGEKDLAQIERDFSSYIETAYQAPSRQQIVDLWQRYLNYRQALATINKPAGEENAAYFADIFKATQNLRQKFFNTVEIDGLFGQEDIYQNYTLTRLNILENQSLSEQEKAQHLNKLFQDLPTDWQENLKTLSQLEDLRTLTGELKARGGSANELKQLRLNLVGAEATVRLEQLDQERQTWKNDVQQYLTARDQVLQSGLSDQVKQQNISQLKQQYFPQKQQQLRLETFENIHDQGGVLPFAQ
jgi:lipase chaperone LimK